MSGIYIHIPFCRKKCNYCDFYLITNLNVQDKFISNLLKEIKLSAEQFGNEKFETIYFGGGTPSILSPFQFELIFDQLYKYYKFSNNIEISIEANPEDFEESKFKNLKTTGINRISFGVQSFKDSELKFLSRKHSASEAERVIINALEIYENINLDLIYSLPGQSIDDLKYSLKKAVEIQVPHISAYTLTIEKQTQLYKFLKKNLFKQNDDTLEYELFNFVSKYLSENNYKQYEISNFAKSGYECKHNLKYWQFENYISFGPSAHSFFNFNRWNNYRDIIKYNSSLENNILPIENKIDLSFEEKKMEYILISLRSGGIDYEKFGKLFKEDFRIIYKESISTLTKNKSAIETGSKFMLSDSGYAVADEIIARFF